MKDSELIKQIDIACHVPYTKGCKKEIQKKIALHYNPKVGRTCGSECRSSILIFFPICEPIWAAKRIFITERAEIMTALR